jgi:uncharacterized protein
MNAQGRAEIRIEWGVKIPLRDGTQLSATLYRPALLSVPAASIFLLTPYVADTYHDRAVYFAERGFPFIVVDARGRGNSEGEFQPFLQEGPDGYDITEWISGQPYCNGQVSMWGGSYNGFSQWATAKQLPPHLTTIVPVAAPHLATDFPMRCNIFVPYLMQWLTYTAGRTSQTQTFSDVRFWSKLYRKWHESGRPFRDLDSMVGYRSIHFQEWLNHPEPDEFWDSGNPTAEQYAQIDIPILTITGSYDDDQPGALTHYQNHIKFASTAAQSRHFLIIGPWNHAGTRTPSCHFGGLEFGPESLLDLPQLHVDWYAWTMSGGPRPDFLRNNVAYYVMGAERWRYADSLQRITDHHDVYYLDSNGCASDALASGTLGASPRTSPPDSYTYDPRDARGPEVLTEASADGLSLTDQSATFALRGRQFVYHTTEFTSDTEVSGFFKLTCWLSIDCPDTDFYVSVWEISSTGSAIRLSTAAIRARYRECLRNPKLIDTDSPLRYDFTSFTFVSREIRRGHRLRLVLAPMGRLLETTFSEKNYNSGGMVADESSESARAVTVRMFHEELYPSALHVPIARLPS